MTKDTENILFTGAGFSAQMGGPLGSEMSLLLFNQLDRASEQLMGLWSKNFEDYESFYQEVIDQNNKEQTTMISNALISIYERIRREYTFLLKTTELGVEFGPSLSDPFEHIDEGLFCQEKKLFQLSRNLHKDSAFSGGETRKQRICFGHLLALLKFNGGLYFFTLNQDSLIEQIGEERTRHNGHVIHQYPFLNPDKQTLEETSIPKEIPETFEYDCKRIPYFKLHGSLQWRNDSKHLLLTGKKKEEEISNVPLLTKYMEVFENTLFNARNLIVIGYSFSDKHINKVIKDACRKNDQLKIHVIDPAARQVFFENYMDRDNTKYEEYKNIFFYPIKIWDMFPLFGGERKILITESFLNNLDLFH